MSHQSGYPDMMQRIRQYREARRRFSLKVYIFAGIFVLISLAQWTVIVLLPFIGDIFLTLWYVPMIFLFLALVIITVFTMFESLRFKVPVNWFMALAFVEFMALGLMLAFVNYSILYFYAIFTVAAVLVAGCIIAGIFIPRDLTLDIVILFVFAVIFFIGSVAFLSLALLANVFYSILVYAIFVILTVLMFIMYHAQTIHGERYAEMRLRDSMLAALIIYGDFVILFTMLIFVIKLLTGGTLLSSGYSNCPSCDTTTAAAGGNQQPANQGFGNY